MTKELAVYQNFEGIQNAAVALHKSGFFNDVKSEAQAIVKVMAGAELGLPPFASMSGIHIVQGKPVLGSNVIATLVKNDPRYDYHIKQADEKACVIVWLENGKTVGESSFTIEEAQRAGLTNKDNWKKWTSDMLFARSISRGARRYAPGIFGGSPVYTPDEMNIDTDEDGYIIEVLPEEEQGNAVIVESEPVKEIEYPENVKRVETSDGTPYYMLSDDDVIYRFNTLSNVKERTEEQEIKWKCARAILHLRGIGK